MDIPVIRANDVFHGSLLISDRAEQNLICASIHFPGIDYERIGDRGIVVGSCIAKEVAIRVEMQDARFGESARR